MSRDDFIKHLESNGIEVERAEKPFQRFYLLKGPKFWRTVQMYAVVPEFIRKNICHEFNVPVV